MSNLFMQLSSTIDIYYRGMIKRKISTEYVSLLFVLHRGFRVDESLMNARSVRESDKKHNTI